MSEFQSENSERFVSAVAEASIRLRRIAEPRPVGDSIKAAINRAAARVTPYLPLQLRPMTPGRAEDLWRLEARRVSAEEMDAIRAADKDRIRKEAKAREHAAELGTLFAGVAERLRQTDPDFHRDDVAALVDAARTLGAGYRALDQAVAVSPSPTEGEGK